MVRSPAIGIDLGTTYSRVGVFRNGKVEIILNDRGERKTPSYVAFKDNQRLIGDAAKKQMSLDLNPVNTIFSVQRLIGRKFEDKDVQSDLKHWPFEVINIRGKPNYQVDFMGEKKSFCPEEISSMILSKLKESAESHLGRTVTDAVLTVPAHFNDLQRQAIKDAATIAGLKVQRILCAPTAAAVALALRNNEVGIKDERSALIFDLGGSSLGVSIVNLTRGLVEVQSTAGKTHLGGEDIDNRMVGHFVQEFKTDYKKDLCESKQAMHRLRTAWETAKITLSSAMEANIELEDLFHGCDFKAVVTRAKFEECNTDLFQAFLRPVIQALEGARKNKAEIRDIVLIGGSTQIPKIRQLLQEFFEVKKLIRSPNAEETATNGAAVLAAVLQLDMSANLQDILLLEATPHSLGIESSGGVMRTLIRKNTSIPTRYSQTFTETDFDGETGVLIKVYEGESPETRNNHLLGQFKLTGIPTEPGGALQIEVAFDIDANSILNVTVLDISSETRIRYIIPKDDGRLREEEIERMVNEAKIYRENDQKEKERIGARCRLESYCSNMKNAFERDEVKVKVTEEQLRIVLKNICDTIRWLVDNKLADKKDFEDKQRDLEKLCDPIIAKVHAGGITFSERVGDSSIEKVD